MSVLDLDLGNTRIKWRYTAVEGAVREGSLAHGADLAEAFAGIRPARVRIASVVSPERRKGVEGFCRSQWQVDPEVARVVEYCGGVRQGYREAARLGVDRWLTLLAAWHQQPSAAVVVSCGTALTVDLLSSDGEHLGGYIVPGLDTMRNALFAGTSAVKLERLQVPDSLEPGRDTVAAVSRGLIRMAVSLISDAWAELAARDSNPRLWISGGDAELLLGFLRLPPGGGLDLSDGGAVITHRPNLVLDGLPIALG